MCNVTIQVDYENPAIEWWDALRASNPALAARLQESDHVEVTPDELERLKSLPGWESGPLYARTPVLTEESVNV